MFVLVGAGCTEQVKECLDRQGALNKAANSFIRDLERLFSSGACKTTVETESEAESEEEAPRPKKAAVRRRTTKKQRHDSSDSDDEKASRRKKSKKKRKAVKADSSDSEGNWNAKKISNQRGAQKKHKESKPINPSDSDSDKHKVSRRGPTNKRSSRSNSDSESDDGKHHRSRSPVQEREASDQEQARNKPAINRAVTFSTNPAVRPTVGVKQPRVTHRPSLSAKVSDNSD